jgi:hypothetical protein
MSGDRSIRASWSGIIGGASGSDKAAAIASAAAMAD